MSIQLDLGRFSKHTNMNPNNPSANLIQTIHEKVLTFFNIEIDLGVLKASNQEIQVGLECCDNSVILDWSI